ncbi:hypothetical protein JHK87_052947 [Glycine soja]|nr:hypothetical protein JHK87_052947 [Glycine soja]
MLCRIGFLGPNPTDPTQCTPLPRIFKCGQETYWEGREQETFIEFVTSEFHNNRNLSDSVAIKQKIKLARDYTFLLNSVHHHKELLFSYNIAVDRSNEVKRTHGKSASSVGLQFPELVHLLLRPSLKVEQQKMLGSLVVL